MLVKPFIQVLFKNWLLIIIIMLFLIIPFIIMDIYGLSLWFPVLTVLLYIILIVCYTIIKCSGIASRHEEEIERNYYGKCICKVSKYKCNFGILSIDTHECLFRKGYIYEQANREKEFSLIDDLDYIVIIPVELRKHFNLV
jgi:energy-coupling factor transporter transmembrane protein EcfT